MNTQTRRVRRIFIYGGPGSGKSTLARQLGARLELPVYDLDQVAFEGLDFHDRPLEARLTEVQRIASLPAWIAEGIFLGWTDVLLDRADAIVWLNYMSWRRAAWRMITRFVGWGWAEFKRQKGLKKFTRFGDYARNIGLLWRALTTSREHYSEEGAGADSLRDGVAHSRAAVTAHFGPYKDKVIECRSARDIRTFVMSTEPETRTLQTVTNA